MKAKKLFLNTCGLIAVMLLTATTYAQVGIGNLIPDPSAMLDITSTSQGLLAPRMRSTDRIAIASPAESLLVFDTDEKAFYFYNTTTTTWVKLANDAANKRNNYKLIKSAADLAQESIDGGGTSYLLNTNTFYEINGTITLVKPINLNNAYIAGMDANEDILSNTGGTVFKGNTGGSIKNLTLKGAKAFEIIGPGIATNSSLLVQNTIIFGMSSSVGSISGLGLYYGGIVQFVGNTNGITYSNIGNCLLDNQAWLDSNNGTFEKFTGNFDLIEKGSGFSSVNGSDIALDVSTAGLAVGTGIIEATVFNGATSAPSGYIKGYAPAQTYLGFNFSNAWSVSAPGIPREGDAEATGDINFSSSVGTGQTTSFSGVGTSSRKKIDGTTTSNNLFRFSRDGDNKITYEGNKTRYFQVAGSVSFQATAEMILILYIAKNGIVITQTKVYGKADGVNDVVALPTIGTVEMKNSDYIEIWAERFSGAGNMLTVSLNLIAR
ncbi:hypothetical protein [Bizionia myxarmorum]|uniref:Cell wall anchor protein n=1 Tax=Bizionia myxarmorum TaxID=291186 RepID=A0A5D0REU4_9FLAO|nr:hypothetical protein [Bizionia myxarmorum]TYB79074.1 hypothetical protein ES674_04670 [Bizionia myxarmorum]